MTKSMITVIKQNDDGSVTKSERMGKSAEEHIDALPIKPNGTEGDMKKEVQRKLLKKKE